MLYYLPLEPYIERYTYMMSCVEGWAESNFRKYGVPFIRIDGDSLGDTIKDGKVLDACGRSYYAMSQIMQVVDLIARGEITKNDTIYVEDFWHPGIESLFYIRAIKKVPFKIGTFIHAQSVDSSDFTWSMRKWIRPIEQGFGKQYDYIFTCSHILQQLCMIGGVCKDTCSNIHKVGLPYNSERLKEQLRIPKDKSFADEKEPFVLFPSRFDNEKDPTFFLDLVDACPDIQFRLVNPRKTTLITSDNEVMKRLADTVKRPNSNLKIINTFDKITYYDTLRKAKVVFNCSHQDWVSWTILEAITFECNPLYPIWKDFPYVLKGDNRYLYQKRNLSEAVEKVHKLMDMPFDKEFLQPIVDEHDNSWHEYLKIMKLIKEK